MRSAPHLTSDLCRAAGKVGAVSENGHVSQPPTGSCRNTVRNIGPEGLSFWEHNPVDRRILRHAGQRSRGIRKIDVLPPCTAFDTELRNRLPNRSALHRRVDLSLRATFTARQRSNLCVCRLAVFVEELTVFRPNPRERVGADNTKANWGNRRICAMRVVLF